MLFNILINLSLNAVKLSLSYYSTVTVTVLFARELLQSRRIFELLVTELTLFGDTYYDIS